MTAGDGRAVEAEPIDVVERRFGARAGIIRSFADALATTGVDRGLIGPREVPRLWSRHLLNSLALEALIGPGEAVADVGSGAGLPGLVVAVARPDLTVSLIEPSLRRVTWLEEFIGRQGIGNARVVRARAEELRSSGERWPVVTARAVAPLERLAGWCLPLLRPHGRLLALKGESAQEELEAARRTLANLGAARSRVLIVSDADTGPATVVEVVGREDR